MKPITLAAAVFLAAFAGAVWAADSPAPTATVLPSTTPTTKIETLDDAKRAADLEVLLGNGKFDEAAEGAARLLTTVRDEAARTTATKILAEAFRKKGEWARASAAYLKLRDRYDKASDEWYRYDVAAEVLKSSVKGVYGTGVTPAVTGTAATASKTISDDETYAAAIVSMADARLKALKAKMTPVRLAKTPMEVVAALKPLMEEARRIKTLMVTASPDVPKALVVTAGGRLKEIADQALPALKVKYRALRSKVDRPWDYSSAEKKDLLDTRALCGTVVEAEKSFQATIDAAGDKESDDILKKLAADSVDRQQSYDVLFEQYGALGSVIPK
jgi:hypothetical protein